MIAIALLNDVKLPATLSSIALFRVFLHSQQSGVAYLLYHFFVGCENGTAFTRRYVLDTIEREAYYVAHRTDLLPLNATAKAMGSIFYYTQAMLSGKGLIVFSHTAVAGIIDRHHGRGAGCNATFGIFQVESQRIGADVTTDRFATGSADGLIAGHESERRYQNFVTRFGHGLNSQMQGCRPTVHTDGTTSATNGLFQLVLKLADGSSHA